MRSRRQSRETRPGDGVPERGAHEVLLSALADGRTRLEMVEHGHTTVEARDMSQAGLEQCLDKMAALVAGADVRR
jgi:hypothetical protein